MDNTVSFMYNRVTNCRTVTRSREDLRHTSNLGPASHRQSGPCSIIYNHRERECVWKKSSRESSRERACGLL